MCAQNSSSSWTRFCNRRKWEKHIFGRDPRSFVISVLLVLVNLIPYQLLNVYAKRGFGRLCGGEVGLREIDLVSYHACQCPISEQRMNKHQSSLNID